MYDRSRLDAFFPFKRLDALLEGIAPGPSPLESGRPLLLSIGEPRKGPPDFVAEEIAKAAAGWSRYPPAKGTASYLEAAAAALCRRYALGPEAARPGGLVDPERALVALPGSREGLFFSVLAIVARSGKRTRPAILIPNPFYHVYAGAALAAGAEPVFVPSTAETGFLPDFAALDPALLDRAAACFLCSPANPQGSVADLGRMKDLIGLARRHDFVAIFDECYSDIYLDAPPPGALEAADALGDGLDRVLAFHSLSKRSGAPGLRCALVAGEPTLIEEIATVLRVGGAGVSLPVLAAGARLWQDEEHVAENRAFYRRNFEVAEPVLGGRFGFHRPQGGFFLWLDVGDGEAAAVRIWREAGIKVLPGAYMCSESKEAVNPGRAYIRLALVDEPDLTGAALTRVAEILE